jgi:hypothetical protein
VVLYFKGAVLQLSPVDAHHYPCHEITWGDVPAQCDPLNLILQYELVVNTDVFDWGRGLGRELVLSVVTENRKIVNVKYA